MLLYNMFWNTYSFSVESIHKVLQSSIFVLLLSDDSVLPDDLLLVSGLQKLNSDPSLLLGLSHQTVHQHLLPPCLLLKNYPLCSKLDHDHDWERVRQRRGWWMFKMLLWFKHTSWASWAFIWSTKTFLLLFSRSARADSSSCSLFLILPI